MNRLTLNKGFRAACICAALGLCVSPGVSTAQETENDEAPRYRNSLGIKFGPHHEEGVDDPLVGLEYTRILDDNFGITVAFDYVRSSAVDREWALAVPARIGFAKRFVFLIGPGLEYSEDTHGENEEEFFVRTGLAVEFELGGGGWFLEPLVELDLFRETEKYFIGVKLGKAF